MANDQEIGKLSASSASTSSVEDMLTEVEETKYATSITDTLSQSNTGNSNATKQSITTINQSDAFISQEFKSIIQPITFESTDITEVEEVSKLTEAEKTALSEFTGVSIANDVDLNQALSVSSTKFSSMISLANTDLSTVEVDGVSGAVSTSNVTDVSDLTKSSFASKITAAMPKIDGVKDIATTVSSSVNIITDAEGTLLEGVSPLVDYDTTNTLATSLGKLCDNVSFEGVNFGYSLSLYNTILSLLAKLGLTGLLEQAIYCGRYWDYDGSTILSDSLGDVALNGDINTFDLIASTLGPGTVGDIDTHFVTMSQNLSSDTTEVDGLLDSIADNTLIDYDAIVTKPVLDTSVEAYSLDKIDALKHDSIQDYIVGSDRMEMIDNIPFLS